MEASTTFIKMLRGNTIVVPSYQRAYSWDTDPNNASLTMQVNVFLRDLEEYNASRTKTPYYFGHFLFEEKTGDKYGVIDGQQRLTTIAIFLSALFTRLEALRPLTAEEEDAVEDLIKRKSTYRFSTVDYDRQLFRDYVIDRVRTDKTGLKTSSAKRIVAAFDFFTARLADKDEAYLLNMLRSVSDATCTTHPVRDESEAIQMFIFQNNRGKKPSNLEIIKAQFMFAVHLRGDGAKDSLIEEIKTRFQTIYEAISAIEEHIREDDVLLYTVQVYFNSLWEDSSLERINKELTALDPIPFIQAFTQSLDASFRHLTTFFAAEASKPEIHSLVTLGGISLAIPFLIKAYSFGLPSATIGTVCATLESLLLRDRVIGTRANLTSRLNGVFAGFTLDNPSVQPLLAQASYLKNTPEWYDAYWREAEFTNALQGKVSPATARFLLWKYENHLQRTSAGKGYALTRYDAITAPELEHIAPQTPTNGQPVAAGYPRYNESFLSEYLDCLGNYLLLSKSHNCAVGNKPFADKRASYTHSAQQRQIQALCPEPAKWTRELIQTRKKEIITFITDNL